MTAVWCGCTCCAHCHCRRPRQWGCAHFLCVLPVLLIALGAGYTASWGIFPGSPVLGALVGCGTLNWAGRRATTALSVPLQAASLLLLALGDVSPAARSVCAGVAFPLAVVSGLFYEAETSGPRWRGLACSVVIMGYLAGRTASYGLLGFLEHPDERLLALAGLSPGLVGLVLMFVPPESPYFLALRGHGTAVPRVLARLRGLRSEHHARAEAEQVVECARAQRTDSCAGNCRGPILAVLLCGSLPLLGGSVIESFLADPSLPKATFELLRVSCGLLQLAAIVTCAVLVDCVGRRPLVLTACVCVALGNATSGYFHFFLGAPDWTRLAWRISAAGMAVSVFGQGLLTGVAWILCAEILPLSAKPLAPLLALIVNGVLQIATGPLLDFLVEKDVLLRDENIFPAALFWGAALWSVLSTFFVIALPETKGYTLTQIDTVFKGSNRRHERTRL